MHPTDLPAGLAERFWRKVNKNGPNGCWLWTGAHDGRGYGQVASGRAGSAPLKAHRVAYLLGVGSIPDGLAVDHLCNTTLCVNPSHLQPKTHRENILRSNGMSARHARQTHCVHGHPFNEENTYLYVMKNGRVRRCCKECNRRVGREKSREVRDGINARRRARYAERKATE